MRNMKKIFNAKEKIKGLALSSDFIVGFPGETDEDFEQTLKAVKNIEYETIFAFKYSPRPGTKASSMPDNISDVEKANRLKKLLDAQQIITDNLLKRQIGETQEILVEGKSKKDAHVYSGRNRKNRIVNFTSEKSLQNGEIVKVKITQAKKIPFSAIWRYHEAV